MRVLSFLRVGLDVLGGLCVCACVVEVGVDHLVSNDLRERRVACACVFARGRICVDASFQFIFLLLYHKWENLGNHCPMYN